MTTKDIRAGRRYWRRQGRLPCRVEKVYGRGRHRYVVFVEDHDPGSKHWLRIRAFAEHFEPLEDKS